MLNPSRKRLIVFCLATLVPGVACTSQSLLPSGPPAGLGAAWFHDDCAPWDGPATTLYLGPEPATDVSDPGLPHLQVALYTSSLRFPTGERIRFDVPGNQGYARYCPENGECTPAQSVTIEFSRVRSDLLEGRLEILFEGSDPIRGGFRARRLPFQLLCG